MVNRKEIMKCITNIDNLPLAKSLKSHHKCGIYFMHNNHTAVSAVLVCDPVCLQLHILTPLKNYDLSLNSTTEILRH